MQIPALAEQALARPQADQDLHARLQDGLAAGRGREELGGDQPVHVRAHASQALHPRPGRGQVAQRMVSCNYYTIKLYIDDAKSKLISPL